MDCHPARKQYTSFFYPTRKLELLRSHIAPNSELPSTRSYKNEQFHFSYLFSFFIFREANKSSIFSSRFQFYLTSLHLKL